jgi:phosphate starvation-inducible PhoH-like protein
MTKKKVKQNVADGEILKQMEYSFQINRKFKLTSKQSCFLEAAKSQQSKILMIDGLWGTGKTAIAIYYALESIKSGCYKSMLYIRNPVEASSVSKMGYLKGDKSEKMAPYVMPGYDLLYEFLGMQTADFTQNYFESEAVSFIRGLNWDSKVIIVDEAENLSKEDILLVMSRIKNTSKLIFVGDNFQKDIRNSGYREIFDLFSEKEDKENGIYTFEFKDVDDIVRSDILRYIMGKLKR